MDTSILEQEFEPHLLKQRRGRSGQMLDYVETPSVIRRLNQAFDYNWSFEIVEWRVLDNEVVVLGKLTAEGIVKMQFGGAQITKSKQNGVMIALADDLKAAGSDCIKKCATLFGIALHLYSESEPATKSETNLSEMSSDQGNNKITKEQLAEVKQLRTKLQWKPEQVLDAVERMFGNRDIMSLNPVMASNLIAYLKNQSNGSNADARPGLAV